MLPSQQDEIGSSEFNSRCLIPSPLSPETGNLLSASNALGEFCMHGPIFLGLFVAKLKLFILSSLCHSNVGRIVPHVLFSFVGAQLGPTS